MVGQLRLSLVKVKHFKKFESCLKFLCGGKKYYILLTSCLIISLAKKMKLLISN